MDVGSESTGGDVHEDAILVVDDNPANLMAIEAAFGELSCSLVTAGSGNDALKALLERDFALILLDVNMPDLDGFETARLIRQRDRSRHLPIIFVTAYDHDDDAVLAGYELGAVDFLFKPIVPAILRAKARVFVELRRQAERVRQLERRNQEQRLDEERRRWETRMLREESVRKDEFLAMLAHELRNPLSPLLLGARLLERHHELDPEAQTKLVQSMSRQVQHLKRLVDDLLEVARITTGKISLRHATLDLRDVVQQALEATAASFERRRHAIAVDLPDEPLRMVGDADRLTQVVTNLLTNASRYTNDGGHVSVLCRRDGEHAVIRVVDDGRGISPEVLPRIFELFVQEQQTGKGLGLGLALVHELVRLHGGDVTVHSAGTGHGSAFEVRLPIRIVGPALDADEPRRDEDADATTDADAPAFGLTIGLVDDEDDVRAVTRALLESYGHVVHAAASGLEGVELARETPLDLMLIDIGMHDVDGYAVARAVRDELGEACPRLVALTGFGAQRDKDRSREAGFDAHLLKPVSPELLQETLLRLTGD